MKTLKNLFLLLMTLWLSSCHVFEQKDETNALEQLQTYLETEPRAYVDKKDYKGALAVMNKGFKYFRKLSAEQQKQFERQIAYAYYDKACLHSLLNQKKSAINAFAKAIEKGYSDYAHAKNDSDLDNIREDQRFIALIVKLEEGGDYQAILKRAAAYHKADTAGLPRFTYQAEKNDNLQKVRTYFKLDSVAGTGDEISQILNLLAFVHDNIRHNGSNRAVSEYDAIDIYNYHKATGKGVNCRHLAITLNECYLSMGFKSRYVTCMPKNPTDPDCHVICTVYSTTLHKWIWVDPTFNAYIKDENGNFLSIAEVRERLISGQPLLLNKDANWNNKNKQTKENYLDSYMAKNLYWINCVSYSRFNPESQYRKVENENIALVPVGFVPENQLKDFIFTSDPDYFWQTPE